jgi:UDP-N-acetylglucosamine 3-dehydrogenase
VPELTPAERMPTPFTAMIDVLENGGTHPLDMHAARKVHEILMAVHESSRRRARIDLPLDVAANPLEEMIAAGIL